MQSEQPCLQKDLKYQSPLATILLLAECAMAVFLRHDTPGNFLRHAMAMTGQQVVDQWSHDQAQHDGNDQTSDDSNRQRLQHLGA